MLMWSFYLSVQPVIGAECMCVGVEKTGGGLLPDRTKEYPHLPGQDQGHPLLPTYVRHGRYASDVHAEDVLVGFLFQ